MHENEIATDAQLVKRLIRQQFPQWAGLPITQVAVWGTDHALYRLGEDLVARLPRIDWAAGQAGKEARWLPVLAPHLPLVVPTPVAIGEPDEGYPLKWSVAPWLPGENPNSDNVDLGQAAMDLAGFLHAMHRADTSGGPSKSFRGGPLAARDDDTRKAIAELGNRIDAAGVTAAWEQALSAVSWSKPPVWIHGDLQAGNLLVQERRLSAVIDFGALGVADPAVDLMPAWSVFDTRSRQVFREAVGCDEDTWQRGKGWALSTALVALPYYWDTFPGIVAESHRKIAAVLAAG